MENKTKTVTERDYQERYHQQHPQLPFPSTTTMLRKRRIETK
jgi:hypothetical protein